MSFIPNTTPTPNQLYNGEMKKMGDTELRVVLLVTRATLGWEIDKKTGMRKIEDWISQSQLMLKSGKSNRAISSAINSCFKHKWIEVRDKDGNLLKTPKERSGKKIFYRLGHIFLSKLTSENSSQVKKPVNLTTRTSENSSLQPVKIVHTTKETLTKETIQKNDDKLELKDLLIKYPNFNSFYSAYPRKVQGRIALMSFNKLNPISSLLQVILKDIEKRKKSKDWKKDDGQFIQYPATYLNQRRWEDEEKQTNLKDKIYGYKKTG